jgi:hypothetical protein
MIVLENSIKQYGGELVSSNQNSRKLMIIRPFGKHSDKVDDCATEFWIEKCIWVRHDLKGIKSIGLG